MASVLLGAALRVLVLVKAAYQARKKLSTASDIYLSILLLEVHQARHQLHRQVGVMRDQGGHSSLTTTTAGTAMVVSLASSSTLPSISAFAKPDDVVVLACCSAMSAEELRTPLEPQTRTSHHRTHCVLQSASWGRWTRPSLRVSTAKVSRSLAVYQCNSKSPNVQRRCCAGILLGQSTARLAINKKMGLILLLTMLFVVFP